MAEYGSYLRINSLSMAINATQLDPVMKKHSDIIQAFSYISSDTKASQYSTINSAQASDYARINN